MPTYSSGQLGQQLPPAWALSSGNLEAIEDQSQIQQDQYSMSGLLVTAGSAEAQANAANAAEIAQQDADGLRESGIGQIVGSSISLATTAVSVGLTTYAARSSDTLKKQTDAENAGKWDTAIKNVLKNPDEASRYVAVNGGEMKDLNISHDYVNPFEGEDGSSAYNKQVPGQMSELLGEDKEAFFKLSDRISKNKEQLDKAFDSAQNRFQRLEDRLGSIGNALNSGSQAVGTLYQADHKAQEVALQSAQKLAEFSQNAIGTTQSIITQAINATGNQINSLAQTINAEASSNKVN